MSYVTSYTGWASNVNQVILDSTTITIGDSATKQMELSGGGYRSLLKSEHNQDKYSVTMAFDWTTVGSDGKTELQRFYEWYKYVHKYGTVPFEFPRILYSQNTGIKVFDEKQNAYQAEYYVIESAVEGNKSGSCVEMKMTWKSFYSGVVSYSDPEITSDDIVINPLNGYADIEFSVIPNSIPTSSDITLSVKSSSKKELVNTIKGIFYDSKNTLRIFYDTLTTSGTYTVTVVVNVVSDGSTLSISKTGSFKV